MRRIAPYALVGVVACAAAGDAFARGRHFGHVGHLGRFGGVGHVGHIGHVGHLGRTRLVGHVGRGGNSGIGQIGDVGCSVFSRHPCAPTVCSVFNHGPCFPQYPFPLGETLQLTVNSTEWHEGKPVDADHSIDTISDMFAALRACWLPPEAGEAHEGMQMAVRFAFKRSGELIAEPRVTYATRGVDDDTRQAYRRAIDQALERCTPLPFTAGMGGAIAGRPIAIRFIDNRNKQEGNTNP